MFMKEQNWLGYFFRIKNIVYRNIIYYFKLEKNLYDTRIVEIRREHREIKQLSFLHYFWLCLNSRVASLDVRSK